jgi:hypothetical protein
MRKLKIIEHISLDGVIQHSKDDDDFPYSDRTAPYRTPEGRIVRRPEIGAELLQSCSRLFRFSFLVVTLLKADVVLVVVGAIITDTGYAIIHAAL